MGENVIHKLGTLDLSAKTALKLVLVAVLAFVIIALGRMGAAKVLSLGAKGVEKAKAAVAGASAAPVQSSDPMSAGL